MEDEKFKMIIANFEIYNESCIMNRASWIIRKEYGDT